MVLQSGARLIGRYEITGELGRGGMGVVYQALDTLDDPPRRVALKQFCLGGLPSEAETRARPTEDGTRLHHTADWRSTFTREKAAEQFKKEAQLLRKFDYPHLPKVTDYFEQGDDRFLAMDLIEGEDLETKLEKLGHQFLPEVQVLDWMNQVLGALDYCHQRGITHRDVKPGNILVTPKGVAYLVDFGIARQALAGSQTLLQGRTEGFSPLEQYSRYGKIDARSDIYAFGATLYALLTGAPPESALERATGAALAPLRQINPAVSRHVEATVLHAMAMDPQQRFASMADLGAALSGKVVISAAAVPATAAAAAEGELPDSLLGLVVGAYHVEEVMGEAEGLVHYKGHHPGLDRPVRLTDLQRERVGAARFETLSQLFRRRAHWQSRLQYPVVLQALDLLVLQPERLVLVTEYLPAETLATRLTGSGAWSARDAAVLMRDLAAGLGQLHRAGVVHANLNPTKVWVAGQQVKLDDFGVARLGDEAQPVPKALLAQAQALYAAPDGEQVTPASDVYSLGCILFEMLTGVQAALARQRGQAARQLRPEIPRWLVSVLEQALQTEADRRYPTAIEMAQALDEGLKPPQTIHLAADGSGDYATLTEAVVELAPGGSIRLGAGEYRLNEPLRQEKALRVQGEGLETTAIVGTAAGWVWRCEEPYSLVAQGVTFQYAGEAPADVLMFSGEELELEACRLRGAVGTAGDVGGSGLVIWGPGRGRVKGCVSTENTWAGIRVAGKAQPILESNRVLGGEVGILYQGQAAGAARQNECLENEVGIAVQERATPTLEENASRKNKTAGLVYSGQAAGLGRGNTCEHCRSGNGIEVCEQAHPVLETNVCRVNAQAGLAYVGEGHGTARQNRCIENGYYGITILEGASPNLEANVCSENAEAGLAYGGRAGGAARSNECDKNKNSGILVQAQAAPALDGNLCRGNQKAGITYLNQAAGQARGNTCQGSPEGHGIRVAGEAQPTLESNLCRENAGSGMAYFDTAGGTARQNECLANALNGILASDQAAPRLEKNICRDNKRHGVGYNVRAEGVANRNECQGNDGSGILVAQYAAPMLEENTCRGNKGAGIVYSEHAGGTARGNTCDASLEYHGIQIGGEAQPRLENNLCRENHGSGVVYYERAAGQARQNRCTLNTSHGIVVQGQAAPTLEKNECQENKGDGIFYSNTAGGTASQNECLRNGGCGIEVREKAQPVLEGNLCRENQAPGIQYYDDASGKARHNTCEASREYHGIGVSGQACPVLSGNLCQRNALSGIAYFDRAAGEARENQCLNNGTLGGARGLVASMLKSVGNGILVDEESHPRLENNICQQNKAHGLRITAKAAPILANNRCSGNGKQDVADERKK
jgi:parallel beta-helix repeat protein